MIPSNFRIEILSIRALLCPIGSKGLMFMGYGFFVNTCKNLFHKPLYICFIFPFVISNNANLRKTTHQISATEISAEKYTPPPLITSKASKLMMPWRFSSEMEVPILSLVFFLFIVYLFLSLFIYSLFIFYSLIIFLFIVYL